MNNERFTFLVTLGLFLFFRLYYFTKTSPQAR